MVFIIIFGHFICPTIARSADEFRLRLNMQIDDSTLKPARVQPAPNEQVTVLERRRISGQVPRQRNVELSSQHLVVIGLDENGQEIARVVVPDPRQIRAEIFDSSGEIVSNELIYQEHAELLLVFPDDPRLRKLKFYHPNWTGTKFVLELVGETQLSLD
jgi:hypothetical protein